MAHSIFEPAILRQRDCPAFCEILIPIADFIAKTSLDETAGFLSLDWNPCISANKASTRRVTYHRDAKVDQGAELCRASLPPLDAILFALDRWIVRAYHAAEINAKALLDAQSLGLVELRGGFTYKLLQFIDSTQEKPTAASCFPSKALAFMLIASPMTMKSRRPGLEQGLHVPVIVADDHFLSRTTVAIQRIGASVSRAPRHSPILLSSLSKPVCQFGVIGLSPTPWCVSFPMGKCRKDLGVPSHGLLPFEIGKSPAMGRQNAYRHWTARALITQCCKAPQS